MNRNDDFARAIRQRDTEGIVRLMFAEDPPVLKNGFRTEGELWDFKAGCPKPGSSLISAWGDIAADVLGFDNHLGGVIVFGVRDTDFSFCGQSDRLDSKLFNDQVRRFLGDAIWVEFSRLFIQDDQRYLGLAVIPPRGPVLERFRADGPPRNGRPAFVVGGTALRDGDSTRVFSKAEADERARQLAIPTLGKAYAVDEPFFRVLSPDYAQFIDRQEHCVEVEKALKDPRAAVAALVGIGGIGKTALATWATLRPYDRKDFAFIVSITAKDRELAPSGIQAIEPTLTSFEGLLNAILDVLRFPELKSEELDSKERYVRELLKDSNGLLFVDNLETVDDGRIIRFLDDLPVGVRALVTSRRTSVRVSVHPLSIGPLNDAEIAAFIQSLKMLPGLSYVSDLSSTERQRIGAACHGLPLAIRWTLGRSRSAAETLARADAITASDRSDDELLEFSFRRVFDSMTTAERSVVEAISLFQRPLPAEAVIVGAGLTSVRVGDALDDLVADAIVQRLFDSDRNDYCFSLHPITRAFARAQVSNQSGLDERIRRRLTDWFEARDVPDATERLVVREIRQGKGGNELALFELGQAAERKGDHESAEKLYQQALIRNPRSWKVARALGEFNRHTKQHRHEALRYYEQAAAHAPRRGQDRAIIFREWGILLKDSGDPDSTDRAIEKLETALIETPNDPITLHALAHMLSRKGSYARVIKLMEPLATKSHGKSRELAQELLLKAYDMTGEMLKAAQLRQSVRDR